MKLPRRTQLLAIVLLAAAVGLAACGSDSKTSTKPASDSSTSSTTAAPASDLKEADHASLGKIFVTSGGKTVYTLTKDGAAVACTGGCLGVWPAVMDSSGQQVEKNGLPVYTFVQDTAAGDAKGEGLESFGGTWNVVKVSGTTSADSGTSSTTAGNGY